MTVKLTSPMESYNYGGGWEHSGMVSSDVVDCSVQRFVYSTCQFLTHSVLWPGITC